VAEVLVIGAGPAGLMAAESAARAGHAVTVLTGESTPGSKFLVAGRGGLNLTHSEDLATFLTRYGDASAWIEPAIRGLTPDALRAWAHGLGQPTMVGSSGRVFPEAFRAKELLRAWLNELDNLGVKLLRKHEWLGFDLDKPEAMTASFRGPDSEQVTLSADAIVLALGGATYPRTGSQGTWVENMRATGVSVTDLTPTNGGYQVSWTEAFRTQFAGVPLKNVSIRAGSIEARGDAMITESGIEGGPIYGVAEALFALGEDRALCFDLAPDLAADTIASRVAKAKSGLSTGKLLKRCAKLSPVAISLLRECTSNQIPREPAELARLIKAATLKLGNPMSMAKAISTRGGIPSSEFDERFMLLAKPGVFVAGEMLDWTAPTGGYLLQASFSTGRAAGLGLAAWLES
jgi:uncharacterized flavoprotein (TIGR03862 family)